jgi:hypothetical protein
VALYKAGREPSPDTELSSILISSFQNCENKCLLFKSHSLGYLIMKAIIFIKLADQFLLLQISIQILLPLKSSDSIRPCSANISTCWISLIRALKHYNWFIVSLQCELRGQNLDHIFANKLSTILSARKIPLQRN